MIFHTPSNGRRFRRYDFQTTTELLKSSFLYRLLRQKKSILGLFGWDSFSELNTKNLDISSIFLSVTYSVLSNSQFRRYGILKINFAVDFCFLTELRLDGTQLLDLGLAKTPEVPNTITVSNSLNFPIVPNMAPNS
jgi:hypothetical protein